MLLHQLLKCFDFLEANVRGSTAGLSQGNFWYIST